MPIVIDFTTSFRFVFLGMLTRLKSLSFSKACVNIMLNNPPNDFESREYSTIFTELNGFSIITQVFSNFMVNSF